MIEGDEKVRIINVLEVLVMFGSIKYNNVHRDCRVLHLRQSSCTDSFQLAEEKFAGDLVGIIGDSEKFIIMSK